MDRNYFVDERLKFINYFYESTVSVFQETMRKIEEGEPPYVDARDPEYAEEPAFLAEWENADAAVNIAGATCLELLQSTLHSCLHQYMKEIGHQHLIPHLHEPATRPHRPLLRLRPAMWSRRNRVVYYAVMRTEFH